MKITENIITTTIKEIVSGIFGVLILLIGLIYPDVFPSIFQFLIQHLSKEALLKITSLVILLSFLLVCLSLFLYLKLRKKLTPCCGIYWDRNKEPFCPSCEKPLSAYFVANPPPNGIYEFYCYKCDTAIRLMHNGNGISLQDAQKLLK